MRLQMITELQVRLQKDGKAYFFWETSKHIQTQTNINQPTKQNPSFQKREPVTSINFVQHTLIRHQRGFCVHS